MSREGTVLIAIGEARYDLQTFEHPGGSLALFGVANSPDPIGMLFQYHEFSTERLASILAPFCVSSRPATAEELKSVRRPYDRVIGLRMRIKAKLRASTFRTWK